MPANTASPPCFFFSDCGRRAELEREGKSVCRECSARLRGRIYPLRSPSRAPLYESPSDILAALDLLPPKRRQRPRIKRPPDPWAAPMWRIVRRPSAQRESPAPTTPQPW